MSTSTETSTLPASSQEQISTTGTSDEGLSTYDLAMTKIVKEIGCTEEDAAVCLEFIEEMAKKARTGARCNTVGTHHLTKQDMSQPGYRLMDRIMGHGATAKEGTAHAAVQRHVLRDNEFALTHANPTGRREDCIVTVNVGSLT